MAEMVKRFWAGMPWGMYIVLLLAFALLVASWAVPPLGVISSSSLQGTALFLGATWLFYVTSHIEDILKAGGKVKASVGNASVEIGRKKRDDENKDEKEKNDEETVGEN